MYSSIENDMKALKLGGLSKEWQTVEFQSKEQYISDLLKIELRERETNRINRMVKAAAFTVIKTLDDFIWTPNIDIPQDITKESIENFSFVDKKENLILMGAVGTGKSHLGGAIALKACQSGKNVRFYTAAGLANLLYDKNQKGGLNQYLNSLKKVDLIVLDEVGFVPLHKDAAELLFQVVSDCYERRSMIITSNLEFSHWNTIFGDNRLTAALIDRLIHHSYILVFSGESYRLTQSMLRIKH
ncbi:MAG TPA: IS21-like element helper ATPase IstB [Ruminiclostridium sp.]